LIRAGVLAQGDILNIDAQIAQERLNLVNAENALEFARLNLMQILDYYDSAIEVVRPQMEVPSPDELDKMDVTQIYQKALSNLPEVKSAQLQKEIAEKDVDIAKGSKLPSVSVSAGASTNYAGVRFPSEVIGLDTAVVGFVPGSAFDLPDIPVFTVRPEFGGKKTGVPFFDQVEQNFSYNIGINASIPIFNRHQITNGIKRAELAVKNAQLTSSITKNALLQSIQQAYQAARSSAQAYETNLSNIQSLEQALANVEKRYELGLATALEYSTARNNLAVAQLNLNSAKYEYMFRLKILEFYEGKPLKF